MTEGCIDVSDKLGEFIQSSFCDDVTTENFLYTWIKLNNAIDVYSVLMSMMHRPDSKYSSDVIGKLEELRKDIEAQQSR